MYTILENTEKLIAFHFSGELDKSDYEKIIPLMEDKIRREGKINLYWEMESFEGWDLSAAWQDIKFDVKHAHDFNRVAMVGQEGWQDLMTQLMKPFTSADVRFFSLEQRDSAMTWVKG